MAIPNTSKPIYPNIPQSPGVPTVLRTVDNVQNTAVLLTSDAQIIANAFNIPQWGLFNSSGQPAFQLQDYGIIQQVLTASNGGNGQSVGDLEFRADNRIATAPQEEGAFLSYNKVSTPFSGRVTYIISGSESQRAQFLAQVASAKAATPPATNAILSLVMPEYAYPSCTVTHYDFRRTARNGVSMFAVDIWVEEVRITGTSAYSNTAAPSGASPINIGTVQPQDATPSETNAVPAGGPT